MTCSFCARIFLTVDAQKSCHSCALVGGCQKIKCPYCGYESPREINAIQFLRKVSPWKLFHSKKQIH